MLKQMNKSRGFTLLEILIALFIFTILSVILMSSLHNVINVQSGVEANAARLRELQLALLVMSRDIEQAVDRPITNASGKEEPAFKGSVQDFTLTKMGYANPLGSVAHSTLQRTRYVWRKGTLSRQTWAALDLATGTKSQYKVLMEGISQIRFSYLAQDGLIKEQWPVQGKSNQGLPKAIYVTLTIDNWGTLDQVYIIPVQPLKKDEKPSGDADQTKQQANNKRPA